MDKYIFRIFFTEKHITFSLKGYKEYTALRKTLYYEKHWHPPYWPIRRNLLRRIINSIYCQTISYNRHCSSPRCMGLAWNRNNRLSIHNQRFLVHFYIFSKWQVWVSSGPAFFLQIRKLSSGMLLIQVSCNISFQEIILKKG